MRALLRPCFEKQKAVTPPEWIRNVPDQDLTAPSDDQPSSFKGDGLTRSTWQAQISEVLSGPDDDVIARLQRYRLDGSVPVPSEGSVLHEPVQTTDLLQMGDAEIAQKLIEGSDLQFSEIDFADLVIETFDPEREATPVKLFKVWHTLVCTGMERALQEQPELHHKFVRVLKVRVNLFPLFTADEP